MPDLLLDECLRWHARRDPKKKALSFLGRSWSYYELNDRVNRLANGFLSLGIGHGSNVAVLSHNTNIVLESCFALARIGAPYVPINYRLSEHEMSEYGERMKCRAWILGPEFEETLLNLMPILKRSGTRHFITMGQRAKNDFMLYEDIVTGASSSEPKVNVHESDCFWIMATGGTTGRSKSVMKNHREWVLSLLFHAIEHGITEEDRVLSAAPLCYGAGAYTAHVTLYVGGSVYILPRFEAEEVIKAIEKEEITAAFMVPTMYNQIVNLPRDVRNKYNVESVRTLISAGSPLLTNTKDEILQFFKGAGLHEYYGASDLSIVTNLRPCDQTRKIRSVGKTILGMEACLLSDEGQPIKQGEVGTLYCRGHGLPMGYYADEQKDHLSKIRQGWATAGDLARMDEEGYYYIVDRKKDMIISGGINIYPREIEEVLASYPDIFEVAVIGIPSEKWGEEVKAYVVLKPGRSVSGEELLYYCGKKLARYKIPKSFSFVKELPKNTAGKILKRKLREEHWKCNAVKVS